MGFNLLIDRISTMRLMTAVGNAIERGAQSITLCISSNGGAPDQAFYIYELLSPHSPDNALSFGVTCAIQI
jgi:ATP-dependent protease ClpP protease subunit